MILNQNDIPLIRLAPISDSLFLHQLDTEAGSEMKLSRIFYEVVNVEFVTKLLMTN